MLPRSFYSGDPREVAPALLNKLLVGRGRAGRIVEVEAYLGAEDPASHAYRGPTSRNATMFGPPGRLYVYFTYGMHFCANTVCGPEGVAQAVLLRALAPVSGIELMRAARAERRRGLSDRGVPDRGLPGRGLPGRGLAEEGLDWGSKTPFALADRDLASGPAKLCQAFEIGRADDGADLVTGNNDLVVVDDGVPPPSRPGNSARVGVAAAAEVPWRWWSEGDVNVSRGPSAGVISL